MEMTGCDSKLKSYRNDVAQYAFEQYGTIPEYPWQKFPEYAVLRHGDSKKWYGVIMNVQREKLGLSGKEYVDILDIKCDPIMGGLPLCEKGILPAYHMHKGNWITVLLDGTVEIDTIFALLKISFDITSSCHTSRKSLRAKSKE